MEKIYVCNEGWNLQEYDAKVIYFRYEAFLKNQHGLDDRIDSRKSKEECNDLNSADD